MYLCIAVKKKNKLKFTQPLHIVLSYLFRNAVMLTQTENIVIEHRHTVIFTALV